MNWLRSKLALAIVLIICWAVAYIFLTPLCGVLFHCGCSWPWAGAADHCVGALDAACLHHDCPWCTDGRLGMWIPLGFILISQTLLITFSWWRFRLLAIWLLLIGLVTFLGAGYLESIIHGWIKHYPR